MPDDTVDIGQQTPDPNAPPRMYHLVGGDQKEYGPASAEDIKRWIVEGRANGQTRACPEGGDWTTLAELVEFAEALKTAQAPSLPQTSDPTPDLMPVQMAVPEPKNAVQLPGIALTAVGILSLAVELLNVVMHLVAPTLGGFGTETGVPMIDEMSRLYSGGLGIVWSSIVIALSCVVVAGGLRMLQLRNYGLCIVAAILAILPCLLPCCCVGLPIGIWTLVVLMRPEVKAAFA